MKIATVGIALSLSSLSFLTPSVALELESNATFPPVGTNGTDLPTINEVVDEVLEDDTVIEPEATMDPTENVLEPDEATTEPSGFPSDQEEGDPGMSGNETALEGVGIDDEDVQETDPENEDETIPEKEEDPADVPPPVTFPPQESFTTQPFTCSSTATPSDVDKCNDYTGALNNVECDCYYFCEGGSLVQCIDNGETKEFGCPGGAEVTACYEKAGESEEEEVISAAAVDSVEEALNSLYYTCSVALGALLCFL